MSWIFIAISAHFFWALVNIGDKYVVGNRVKNPYVYMVWMVLLGSLVVALIPFINFVIPEQKIFWLLVLGSAIHLYSVLPYARALQIEEITRINIWWQMIPIFSFIIAWVIMDEKLSANQIIAMLILISGGIIASLHFKLGFLKKNKFVFSKAFWLMAVSCFGYAWYAVIFHYVTQYIPFMSAFVWMNILMVGFALTLFISKKFRKDFWIDTGKLDDKRLLSTVLGITVLDVFGTGFNIWALSLGPVALVFAMEGWQILFVFILAIGISLFRPKVLKEELDKRNLILKLAALVLMMVGVAITNLG